MHFHGDEEGAVPDRKPVGLRSPNHTSKYLVELLLKFRPKTGAAWSWEQVQDVLGQAALLLCAAEQLSDEHLLGKSQVAALEGVDACQVAKVEAL